MPTPEAVAAFQNALLTLLAEGQSEEAIRAKLRDDPVFADFREYVEGFDPRMIRVAVALVAKWGRLRTLSPATDISFRVPAG